MKLQEIRGVCNTNFSHKRNEEICEQLKYTVDIDGDLIGTVYSEFMNYNPNQNPMQIIDSVLNGEDSNNSGLIYKGWCNTWPFGMPTDKTYPRFLAICRGEKRLNKALEDALDIIKQQSKKMVKDCNEKYKTVILLTDIWSLAVFKNYEKIFLKHALRDGIWYIFLLVTEYGYTQIPFLPNDRNALARFSNEVVEDDLTIDDVYELLEPFNYAFEYTSRGGSWDPHISKKYVFDLRYMEWHKISMYDKDKNENGKISEKALLQFIDSVLWIKDIKESKREVNYRTSNPYISTLHIFGKEVEWDKTGGSVIKLINELNNNIEKFIKACEKTRGR